MVHPKGRPDPWGAPALRDRAATGGRDWMGWDGVLWEVVRGIFCLSSLSSHLFRLALFLHSLPGHVAHVAPSKGLLLSKQPPLSFPTQPRQLSSFEASAKKPCEKGAA